MTQKQEAYAKALALVKEGKSVKDACKTTGITPGYFYSVRATKGPKRRLGMKPIVIQAAPEPRSLAVAFGNPSEVAALIRELR